MYRRHRRHSLLDLDWLDYAITSGLGAARHGVRGAGWAVDGLRGRRRTPSLVLLLIAGLVVLALARVMSAANGRNRSTTEKVILGLVLAGLAAFALSLRNSGRRYRW